MSNDMTNWRELILKAMEIYGESLKDIISNTLNEQEMDVKFSRGHKAGLEGQPFTIWTDKRVYFPAVYDGSEWVESVSRNPDGNATHHIGGG